MARLRREDAPAPPPANLEHFHLADWLDLEEPVPADRTTSVGMWRHLRAFRRWQEAKRAWRP